MASSEGSTKVNKAAFNVSIFYVKLCHKCQMIGEERRAPRNRDHMFVCERERERGVSTVGHTMGYRSLD